MKYENKSYGDFEKIITDFEFELKGKLIVVTSINPTGGGEGKTTTLIGLNDLFNNYQKKAIGCLRQPSIGPFLGRKGGATGSGECQLINDLEINLGLTGDFEKISLVNNLIVTIIENHIFYNTELKIDPKRILLHRCVDLNDRSLREIKYQISDKVQRNESFQITAASSLMAAFALVNSPDEFETICKKAIVAFSYDNKPITVDDLKLSKTITKILKNVFYPNIVKSKYGSEILMHGGPFANIAHGCNTIIATKMALSRAEYVFTECGFGSDLGLEKFINIKCRKAGLYPNLIIYAISLQSIIIHGDGLIDKGIEHLKKHLLIANTFNVNAIVILNKFINDQDIQVKEFLEKCKIEKIKVIVSNLWSTGPNTSESKLLFNFINENISNKTPLPQFTYSLKDPIMTKIDKITKNIYGAKKLQIENNVIEKIANLKNGEDEFMICIAKDQTSIIGNKLNNDTFYITDININYFSKLIILISSKIFLMPGLPIKPNAAGEL
ncbi:MAG: formate--tetrahydrofolate ligase [Mycoplasmoidaceae bacterium]